MKSSRFLPAASSFRRVWPPSFAAAVTASLLFSFVTGPAVHGQTVAPATPAKETDAVVLSPFTVSGDQDNGYQAANTLAGSRLNTKLSETPASVSVFTEQFFGVVWAAPFSVDCTGALRDGKNEIVVEVVGTWHNRLVGEARGALPKLTRTNITVAQRKPWKDLEPIEAGLFGPVRLVARAADDR